MSGGVQTVPGHRSRLGFWLTLAAVAVMFAAIVVVCGWSIPG